MDEKRYRNDFSFEGSQTPAQKRRNFDQKVHYFPPEFNALREELETHWKNFFHTVNPDFEPPMSPAYAMAFAAPSFISMMNEAFDMWEELNTDDVAGICERYLKAARKKRGI